MITSYISYKVFVSACLILLGLSLMPLPAQAIQHDDGTNVSIDGTVYYLQAGLKRPYTSEAAFLSYGFNSWDQVVPASPEDAALPTGPFVAPQDGKIICSTGERAGTCYLITDGWKIGFVSEAQFRELGFSFERALYGDVSFLGERQNIESGSIAHPPGVLVRDTDGTIYLVHPSGLAGFPNLSVFQSWGYTPTDVVPMNNNDRLMPKVGLVSMRQPYQLIPPSGDWVSSAKAVNIKIPNGGEEWSRGSNQRISWDNTTFDTHVDIWLQEYHFPCHSEPCPLNQFPISSYSLVQGKLNTGEFDWVVGKVMSGDSIPEGLYKISIQGSNKYGIADESDFPFAILGPKTEALLRDATRVATVRQMASVLELYYNDHNRYPARLSDTVPFYISKLPTAPTPADGSCSRSQNTYTYQKVSDSQYRLTFCLGQATGIYGQGVRTLSETGID